jgi:hypothetical protein
MATQPLAILSALLVLAVPADALAKTHRDPHERVAFMKQHPCPSTGKTRGACPGYVVDHVKPLCAGGPDHASNMQWQTMADAKVKDKEERQMCRAR